MSLVKGLNSLFRASEQMRLGLIDRDREVYLAMVALVSRQHLFLFGPPGTAKTLVAMRLGQAVGGPFFSILMSRFTTPDEVFGPISIKGLIEREVYERKTTGYLPEARVAVLDEIWKSSSAILNSLLTLVNERQYDNGGRRIKVPLETAIAMSNELPDNASLAALYDRFLLRHEVRPVADPSQLLDTLPTGEITPLVHLDKVQEACEHVVLTDETKAGMVFLRDGLTSTGITIGDRRFRASAALVKAVALLKGRRQTQIEDLDILGYCYWETPDQIPKVHQLVSQATATRSTPRTVSVGVPSTASGYVAVSKVTTSGAGGASAGGHGTVTAATNLTNPLSIGPQDMQAQLMSHFGGSVSTLIADKWLHRCLDAVEAARGSYPVQFAETCENMRKSIQGHIRNTPGATWG